MDRQGRDTEYCWILHYVGPLNQKICNEWGETWCLSEEFKALTPLKVWGFFRIMLGSWNSWTHFEVAKSGQHYSHCITFTSFPRGIHSPLVGACARKFLASSFPGSAGIQSSGLSSCSWNSTIIAFSVMLSAINLTLHAHFKFSGLRLVCFDMNSLTFMYPGGGFS